VPPSSPVFDFSEPKRRQLPTSGIVDVRRRDARELDSSPIHINPALRPPTVCSGCLGGSAYRSATRLYFAWQNRQAHEGIQNVGNHSAGAIPRHRTRRWRLQCNDSTAAVQRNARGKEFLSRLLGTGVWDLARLIPRYLVVDLVI
jgi:hypothetical protein